MGSNVLIVRGGGAMFGGRARRRRHHGGLNDGDVEAIKKEADTIKFAAPEVSQPTPRWCGAG